jgi:uncharacterized membrane protein
MTIHRFGTWSYKHLEQITGGATALTVNVTILSFAMTLLQTAILALVSGALGALGGYLIKKYVIKPKQNETN